MSYGTHYQLNPTALELKRWNRLVTLGLAKTSLRIAILQTSSARDELRISLSSAAMISGPVRYSCSCRRFFWSGI